MDERSTVPRRTFWAALAVTALLAAGGGLGLSALVLGTSRTKVAHAVRRGHVGPRGPAGAQGPRGPRGARGAPGRSASPNAAAVVSDVTSNARPVARAVQPQLTPDPRVLCTDLKRVHALAGAHLPC